MFIKVSPYNLWFCGLGLQAQKPYGDGRFPAQSRHRREEP